MHLKTKSLQAFIALLILFSSADVTAEILVEQQSILNTDNTSLEILVWRPESLDDSPSLPMIIISHGAGGAMRSHTDTAESLAKRGYVVAAVEHTGDNYRDSSGVQNGTNLTDRPLHISRALDYLLDQWPHATLIDHNRIGMFGFSAGGFTALVLAGGKPDTRKTAAWCETDPDAWVCRYLQKNGVDPASIRSTPAAAWRADPRIKAAVIAAPAVGYMFDPDGLAAVSIPIQLWHAEQDTIVEESALTIRKLLPTSEFHTVRNAGHFAFMTPCGAGFRLLISVMEFFGTEPICDDPKDFDRERFHEHFNTQLVVFFDREL